MYGKNVVIVGWKRTPIGIFMGSLASFTSPNLGSMAIQGALAMTRAEPKDIEEVIIGNVLQSASGQAPARQAALGAGLSIKTPWTTINKSCISGMNSVIMASQMIQSGHRKWVIGGGMESMTSTPHYSYIRKSIYSHRQFVDSIIVDGYNYDGMHLGAMAEKTIAEMEIPREALDEWARMSYERAQAAQSSGLFQWEIVDILQDTRKGQRRINDDEECKRYYPQSIPLLQPIYIQ